MARCRATWLALAVSMVLMGQGALGSALGVNEWCSTYNNTFAACNPPTDCQTADTYWSVPTGWCKIPGDPSVDPFVSFDSYGACGVKTMGLQDVNGKTYGTLYIYRTFENRLIATALINGTSEGQWYYEYPSAEGYTVPSAILTMNQISSSGQLPPDTPQYADPVFSSGKYTCVTWDIDLGRVCDPDTSFYSANPAAVDNAGCQCREGFSQCPTLNLTASTTLVMSVRLNISRYSLVGGESGCGTRSESRLVGSKFQAVQIPILAYNFYGVVQASCPDVKPDPKAPRPP
eukprot:CAMPEP_0202867486 /NCGR_PEP_ID=MMETSP1391-20130828/9463_1 /ASSEMBLY_ACC=CAM_ASM_000867 /TAXON_ID=1034604 /ORGANISM="Chlamydomonas leiostraca, Strain SAG 11-49" /LENGTH=288 /DNA_ID=CAMNT_0049547535 /DNA_START=225 /DNA_END=1088 /DNA_ORIENTATION=-